MLSYITIWGPKFEILKDTVELFYLFAISDSLRGSLYTMIYHYISIIYPLYTNEGFCENVDDFARPSAATTSNSGHGRKSATLSMSKVWKTLYGKPFF